MIWTTSASFLRSFRVALISATHPAIITTKYGGVWFTILSRTGKGMGDRGNGTVEVQFQKLPLHLLHYDRSHLVWMNSRWVSFNSQMCQFQSYIWGPGTWPLDGSTSLLSLWEPDLGRILFISDPGPSMPPLYHDISKPYKSMLIQTEYPQNICIVLFPQCVFSQVNILGLFWGKWGKLTLYVFAVAFQSLPPVDLATSLAIGFRVYKLAKLEDLGKKIKTFYWGNHPPSVIHMPSFCWCIKQHPNWLFIYFAFRDTRFH